MCLYYYHTIHTLTYIYVNKKKGNLMNVGMSVRKSKKEGKCNENDNNHMYVTCIYTK